MPQIRNLRAQTSFTRCYRLCTKSVLTHLESQGKFNSLHDIRMAVTRVSDPMPTGNQAVLFVHRDHLPNDFIAAIDDQEAFHRFCEVVAFSSRAYELHNAENSLPASPDQHGECRITPCMGFPIPQPVAEVDQANALSFGIAELRDFLGTMQRYAGRMIVLNLTSDEGTKKNTPTDFKEPVAEFVRTLQRLAPR